MKKVILLILTLSLVFTAGCSSNNSSNGAKSEKKEPKTTKEIKLNLWLSTNNMLVDELEQFQNENPNIKVTAEYMGNYDEMSQKVMAAIISNTTPHVAQLGQRHGIPQMADSGKLIPIDQLLSGSDLEDVFPGFWDRFTYKDKKWTIPFQSSTPVMYYNKTMFEENNLTAPKTWDELITVGKQLTKGDVWGVNWAGDSPWYFQPMTWNRGGDIISKDGNVQVNGKNAVETLKSIQDLVHVHKIMPANQFGSSGEDFVAGKLGILFRSGASLRGIKKQVGDQFEIGIAFLPKIDEQWLPIGGNSLGVFASDEAHEEASAKLVSFLTSTENTAKGSIASGYIPIRKSAHELPAFKDHLKADSNFVVTIKQAEFLRGQPINPADALIWSGLVNAIEVVHSNKNVDPQTVLDELQAEVKEYLKNY